MVVTIQLHVRPSVLRVRLSWRSVINENHLIVWVEVESCISKEVVEPFSIHSSYNGSVVHKPELQNHFFFSKIVFFLNACDKLTNTCTNVASGLANVAEITASTREFINNM